MNSQKTKNRYIIKKEIQEIETKINIKSNQIKLLQLKIDKSLSGRFISMSKVVNPYYSIGKNKIKEIENKKKKIRNDIELLKNKLSKLKKEYKEIK